MIEAAAAAGRMLTVGHIERFNPAIRELRRRLDAGELGRIFQISATRLGPFPARIRDVGVVVDLAPHDLDVMRFLVGAEPVRIYAEAERRIHTDHEDLFTGIGASSRTGSLGVLNINWLTPTKQRVLTVTGERGMYVADYITPGPRLLRQPRGVAGDPSTAARRSRSVTEGEMTRRPVTPRGAARGRAARVRARRSRRRPAAGRSARRDGRAAAGAQDGRVRRDRAGDRRAGPRRRCWREDRRHRARPHRPAAGRPVRLEGHDVTRGRHRRADRRRRSTAASRRTPTSRRSSSAFHDLVRRGQAARHDVGGSSRRARGRGGRRDRAGRRRRAARDRLRPDRRGHARPRRQRRRRTRS